MWNAVVTSFLMMIMIMIMIMIMMLIITIFLELTLFGQGEALGGVSEVLNDLIRGTLEWF